MNQRHLVFRITVVIVAVVTPPLVLQQFPPPVLVCFSERGVLAVRYESCHQDGQNDQHGSEDKWRAGNKTCDELRREISKYHSSKFRLENNKLTSTVGM